MNKYDEDLGQIENVENLLSQARGAAEKIKHVDADDLLSELSNAESACERLEIDTNDLANEEEERKFEEDTDE